MRYLFYSFLLAIVIILTGCAKEPEPVKVKVTVVEYKYIPNHFLEDNITIPKPPTNEFKYMLPNERENILKDLSISLYKTIGIYKLKLRSIRDYEKQMKEEE